MSGFAIAASTGSETATGPGMNSRLFCIGRFGRSGRRCRCCHLNDSTSRRRQETAAPRDFGPAAGAPCPHWGKSGKTQKEQMLSALPRKLGHVSKSANNRHHAIHGVTRDQVINSDSESQQRLHSHLHPCFQKRPWPRIVPIDLRKVSSLQKAAGRPRQSRMFPQIAPGSGRYMAGRLAPADRILQSRRPCRCPHRLDRLCRSPAGP